MAVLLNQETINPENNAPYFRMAFAGEMGCGKRDVRRAFVQMSTAHDKLSQLDSNTVRIQGRIVELITVDTESEFEKIPHMPRCSHLDTIVLFYDISSPAQFRSIHNTWVRLIQRLYPTTPFIICATGIEARVSRIERSRKFESELDRFMDLEDTCSDSCTNTTTQSTFEDSRSSLSSAIDDISLFSYSTRYHSYQRLITWGMGNNMARYVKAASFQEVSAKTLEGVQRLFDMAVKSVLEVDKVKYSLTRCLVGRAQPRDACSLM